MDTKKLRQKILDLAIHGKLVPQDPNDEPASVLLERIRKEKEQLIKEGKIKAPKKGKSAGDTSHYPKEVPWELPEGWCWTTIGDVFIHNTGKALNSADREGRLLSYITTSNLYWDRFELSTLKKMLFTEDELEKCTARKGDLLVCEGGDIGRAAIWNQDYEIRIQNHIHKLRGLGGVNHRLFMFWLMYMKEEGMIGGKGIGLMGLSSREFDKLLIPLPPLCEQSHLVDRIDGLFSVVSRIEKTETVLFETVSVAKSRILDLAIHGKLVPQDSSDEPAIELLKHINPAFKPSHNLHYEGDFPNGWVLASLGEVSNYGHCISVPVEKIGNDDWVLELEDIEKDTGRILQRLSKKDRKISGIRHQFKKGQILYSKLRTYLNKVLIADEDGFCTTEIIPITPIDGVNALFLIIVLRSQYFLDYTQNCCYGVKMPRLGTNDAKKAFIPLPPFEEQGRIVAAVKGLFLTITQIGHVIENQE